MPLSKTDLLAEKPPAGISDPAQALWWLAKGNFKIGPEWENAHNICQSHEGLKPYDWVHGFAHWIEGDEWNSNYWYRHAGEYRHGKTFLQEWQYLITQIS